MGLLIYGFYFPCSAHYPYPYASSDVLVPVFRGFGTHVFRVVGTGVQPCWQLVSSLGCYQGSALLVGGVVGTGQSLAQVAVAEVEAFAADGAGA